MSQFKYDGSMNRLISHFIDLGVVGVTSGACYECIRLSTTEGVSIILGVSIGPGVYFAVFSMGVLDLGWRWKPLLRQIWLVLRQNLPSAKLRALAEESASVVRLLEQHNPHNLNSPEMPGEVQTKVYRLAIKLRKMKITTRIVTDAEILGKKLPYINSYLELGDIKGARVEGKFMQALEARDEIPF